MQKPKAPHTMKAFGRHVLQKASQKLESRERHPFALMSAAVRVAKGDGMVVERHHRMIADRRLVHIATQVLQYLIRPLHDGFGKGDPLFLRGD
jgi:uncharacterized membrane protein YebE (DUF533 family)